MIKKKNPITRKYILMTIKVESDFSLDDEDCQGIVLDIQEKLEELSDLYYEIDEINTDFIIDGFGCGDTHPFEGIENS
jgi:hypothetical protein